MAYNHIMLMKSKVMAEQYMRFQVRYRSMKGFAEELVQEWPHTFLTHTIVMVISHHTTY